MLLGDRTKLNISYSEWYSWEDAREHYRDDEYAGLRVENRAGATFLGPKAIKASFRASMMYARDNAFSATVIGETEEAVRQGIKVVVDFRPPREFRR